MNIDDIVAQAEQVASAAEGTGNHGLVQVARVTRDLATFVQEQGKPQPQQHKPEPEQHKPEKK